MTENSDKIALISDEALRTFEHVSSAAAGSSHAGITTGAGAFATMNTLTYGETLKNFSAQTEDALQSMAELEKEPAISRVVVKENGKLTTYYVSRTKTYGLTAPPSVLVGYRTPLGRIASYEVGDDAEIITPGGRRLLHIVEVARLRPRHKSDGWDSIDSIVEGAGYGPITVPSFRALLLPIEVEDTGDTVLNGILVDEERARQLIEGIRRRAIEQMSLRDQPTLDRYQDEIFRLPLARRLLIVGPPGTGKTTTLIRRIGQKLDTAALEQSGERVPDSASFNRLSHTDSWIMFTPTDLLKAYLKEAFALEKIPASDQRTFTWKSYREELARNRFRILRTSAGGGAFTRKEDLASLEPGVLRQQGPWFDDFHAFQQADFWADLRGAATALAEAANREIAELGRRVSLVLDDAGASPSTADLLRLVDMAPQIAEAAERTKAETDGVVRRGLNLAVNADREFLTKLGAFLDTLGAEQEDTDEAEDDEEGVEPPPRTPAGAAMAAFNSNMRSQARARGAGRTLPRGSRAARIAEWIGARGVPAGDLPALGISLSLQAQLRKLAGASRRYLAGVPQRYRRFRRDRQAAGQWYRPEGFAHTDIGPLEIDLILLSILRMGGELLQNRTVRRDLEESAYSELRKVADLVRNQVVVDEATDFSPVQLACMAAIGHPDIRSFFACGDFNQRITTWGSADEEEFSWALPSIEIRPIVTAYRQSRQLGELAGRIITLNGGTPVVTAAPRGVINEGFAPVLGTGLQDMDAQAAWIADRIIEVEKHTKPLPTVAVLVNHESEVGPLAAKLRERLADENLNVVPCHEGQLAGRDNDIRVFDVQHIKGLEFEAVFFAGIDELATAKPELFDKFLYVGCTRAATFLGVTSAGDLPPRAASLADLFAANWA